MIYTINELKKLKQEKKLTPIEFFNLSSKLTKTHYKNHFPEYYNSFFTQDLSLKDMRRYYHDEVFKFYIDNLEDIKLNNNIFLDYISELDSNKKKSLTRCTIKSTYPIILDTFLDNLNKEKPFNNNINYYMLGIIKGSTFKDKSDIEKEVLKYLGTEAEKDFEDGCKLSYIVRRYYFNEEIQYRCRTCRKPIEASSSGKECLECYIKFRQERENLKRKNYILNSTDKSITFLSGNFQTTNFYDEEYEIHCSKCNKITKFFFKSKERVFRCSCDKENISQKINAEFSNIFEMNNRRFISPKEVDFIYHDKKLCIEYDGLMYHSHGISEHSRFNNPELDKYYHLDKTEKVQEKGYSLYHIFENEWLDLTKRSIWKSIINEKLGLNEKINLDDYIIKNIDKEKIKEFVLENTLDKYMKSEINLGLYLGEELYSVVSFNSIEDNNYRIVNLATKNNYSVDYSVLISYFEEEYKPKSIEYYSNRRYLKEIKGFEFIENTEPRCYFFNKKLNLIELENENIEDLFQQGYRVIYDCGQSIFRKAK